MTHDLPAQLDHLAGHIDRYGFDATAELAIRQLLRPAVEAGVRLGLIDLLLDTATPIPVRNRAFGHIATLVVRHSRGEHSRGEHSRRPVVARTAAAA